MIHFVLISIFFLMVSCNQDISKNISLNGLSETEVIEKLGQPIRSNILELTHQSRLLEYQSDLLEITSKLNKIDTVKIKEMYWGKKKYKQVVWLKKSDEEWKVIDNLCWSNNIQF